MNFKRFLIFSVLRKTVKSLFYSSSNLVKNQKMPILVRFLCNLIEFQKISNLFCFKKNSENRSFMTQLTWWKVENTSFCRRMERLKCDNSIRCAKLSQNLVFSTFHQVSWAVKQRFSLHFLKQKRLVIF